MKTTSHVSKAQANVVRAGLQKGIGSKTVHVKGHTRDAKGGGTYGVKGYDKVVSLRTSEGKELEENKKAKDYIGFTPLDHLHSFDAYTGVGNVKKAEEHYKEYRRILRQAKPPRKKKEKPFFLA